MMACLACGKASPSARALCPSCIPAPGPWVSGPPYRYPDPADPLTSRLKRLAARAARATGTRAARAHAALSDCLRDVDDRRLRWAETVLMLDPRWNGATGEGGYWALATEILSRAASAERSRRRIADGGVDGVRGAGRCPRNADGE